ncbi:9111_t:CDS:2, partial [Funneliformis geosporum]
SDPSDHVHAIDINTGELSTTFQSPIFNNECYDSNNNNTKNSLFDNVKSWYKPVYVDAPNHEKPKPRYFNGQLSKSKFILIHFMMISFLFTIILAPLVYFIIIPAILRYKIKKLDLNRITIDYMDVKEWKSNGLKFSLKAIIPKQFFLPMQTKLAALNLTLHDANSISLLKISVPEMEINIGKPIVLEFEGDVIFKETGLNNLIGKFSQPDGLQETSISADTQITVQMWGVTWYKNLDVKRILKIPKLDGNLMSLWNNLPKFLLSQKIQEVMVAKQTVDTGGVNAIDSNKPLIIDGIVFWQILPGFPPINIKALDIVFTDAGPSITLKALMMNPTVLSVILPDTTFGLQLENSYLATIDVKGFNLTQGLNDLDLNLRFTFDENRIVSPDQLSNSISEAIGKLLEVDEVDEGLRFNIIGPVVFKDVDIIREITEKLSLALPINEIIENNKLLINLLNAKGIENLLHKIHLDIKVQGDQIIIPAVITIPSFLPLPPSFEFKYNISFGIFKGEQNALTVALSEISMTNGETLKVQITVTITPNNTLEAADALASIVNPSLFGNISSADIKNFEILKETGETFPWVDRLLDRSSLNIPIPGFNTTSIINMMTQNGTNLPAKIIEMEVMQRSDVAGFDINGIVAIEYPPIFPIITISIGYVDASIFIDDKLLTTAKLPNGIEYAAGENATNIVASTMFNKDDRLKSTIADLVISMKEMHIISLSGVKLGSSEVQNFVTFSKVVVPIDLSTLRSTIKTTIKTISQSIQQQTGLLSITGVDFAVISSNSLSVNAQTNLNNPTNIKANIGSVSFITTLFYGELVNLTISPIKFSLEKCQLNLQMKIELVNGKNGMSDNILKLYNDLIDTEGNFRSIIGIKSLMIFPPLTQSENSNVTLATIDQFFNVHITIPPSYIPAEKLRSINLLEMIKNPQNIMIDISGLLPTSETTFAIPTISSISVETKENSQLQIQSAINYTNPLPISARIPFFGATIVLDGKNLVTFGINQFDVARNEGNMNIVLLMRFDNTVGTKTAVNDFIKNILNGKIKQKIELSGIYFGGTNEEDNDSLSSLSLPLPTDLIDVKLTKDKIFELSPIKLPINLNELLSCLQLHSVDITTFSDRILSLQIGAKLNLPFEIKVDIDYFVINGITLDHTQFTFIEIFGIKNQGVEINDISLGIQCAFNNEESIPQSVKNIYISLINGEFISTIGGINGIAFGISKEDSVRTLEQISLSTGIGNLITGQLNLNDSVSDIHNDNNSILISMDQGSISLNIPKLVQMVISQLEINFLPGKIIEIIITTSISIPFSLTMNIGFAGLGIFLDDLSTVDILLSAMSKKDSVSITTLVIINDSDELANKLGELTQDFINNTPLKGNFVIRNPIIGISNDDNINALSLISLELSLERLITPIIKYIPKSMDPITLIDQFGFQMDALEISSTDQHSMLFSIVSGNNNRLSIVSELVFQVLNDQVPDKIASFVNSLQRNRLGGTGELFSIKGFKVGVSLDDHIKVFEKVVVRVPTSSILNQQVVEKLLGMFGLSLTELTIDEMLNRLDIGNIVIDMNPDGQELIINGKVGIKNISLPLNVDLRMIELSVALNASPLARIILPDIKTSSYNNVITTCFTAALIFQDSDELQEEIATLAKSLIEGTNDTVISRNANINGLSFGTINIFRKMSISLPLNPILQPIKMKITSIIKGFIYGTGRVKFALDDVTVGIKNSNTLITDVIADIIGLPDITFNIPFASVDVAIDDELCVSNIVNGMKFEGGRFTTSVELIFQNNKQLANKLTVVGSDLVFRRLIYTIVMRVGVSNLIFGPSSQKTFGFTRKVEIEMDVGGLINEFSEFNQKNNLLIIDNIQSQITQQGIDVSFTVPAIPNLPLNVNIHSLLAHVFFQDVDDAITKAIGILNVQKGQCKWEFGLFLDIENGPMSQALEMAVPNLLKFKSYTHGAFLGSVTLCNSKDCLNLSDDSFKIFNEITFVPPPLFLWNPITVDLVQIIPTIILNVSFKNIGPLHVDIGNFVLSLENNGSSIFEVYSSQSVVIQNDLENSGQNNIPMEVKFTLNPLEIPKLLLDIIDFEKDFNISLRVSRNEGQIEWLNDLLKELPQTFWMNFLPILRGLLKNIKLGIDLNNDKIRHDTAVGVDKGCRNNETDVKTPPPNTEDAMVPNDSSTVSQNDNPSKQPKKPPKGKEVKQLEHREIPSTEEIKPSIGDKILESITNPFESNSLTNGEGKKNIIKPILTWTIGI